MKMEINISSVNILMKLYEKTVKRSENIPLILNKIRQKNNLYIKCNYTFTIYTEISPQKYSILPSTI